MNHDLYGAVARPWHAANMQHFRSLRNSDTSCYNLSASHPTVVGASIQPHASHGARDLPYNLTDSSAFQACQFWGACIRRTHARASFSRTTGKSRTSRRPRHCLRAPALVGPPSQLRPRTPVSSGHRPETEFVLTGKLKRLHSMLQVFPRFATGDIDSPMSHGRVRACTPTVGLRCAATARIQAFQVPRHCHDRTDVSQCPRSPIGTPHEPTPCTHPRVPVLAWRPCLRSRPAVRVFTWQAAPQSQLWSHVPLFLVSQDLNINVSQRMA